MCGIAGFVGDPLPSSAEAVVQRMVRSLVRRGPDGEGWERWPSAILAHRRLAIFDLSDAGRQPMLSPDGEVAVVFNGAIYNFLELRAELQALGCTFQSHCDTEVLVHGYRQWGIDRMVDRLRGMFAFAVWDNRERKLVLVRDRLGVKPLVYSLTGDGIAFASTLTALYNAGIVDSVDDDAVLEFLEFGWVSEERSIFEGAAKVPPATIVEWSNGRLAQRRYWEPSFEPVPRSIEFGEAVERTEQLLLESVRLRLQADVPVGALLSGGIDSTLVCWAMSQLGARISAFTIGTPGDPCDEAQNAAITANRLGIPHEVVELVPQLDELSELTGAYGEPFGCSSALGMLRICRAIRRDATVLLTGDGGDDVFLGYTHHLNFWRAQRLAAYMPSAAAGSWKHVRRLVSSVSALRRPVHLMDYATSGLGATMLVHDGLPFYEQRHMLGERLQGRILSHRNLPVSPESARRLLPEFLDYERRTRFVSEYMTKVDGASMHYGVEVRSPFLDHKLWESAAALPYDVRLKNGELKAVLRAIVRRRVGDDIARRPKQGFAVPVQTWLASLWKSHVADLPDSSPLVTQGWIRGDILRTYFQQVGGQGNLPRQVWYLVVLDQWLRTHSHRHAVAGDCVSV